jgi:autotransporter passenger strand-loop-strand repeat protein
MTAPTTVVKVGTEFLVNSQITGSQWYPTVTGLSNGGFVVTWQDGLAGSNSGSGALGDASGSAVHAQMFAADGSKVGGEFLVNTQTNGSQAAPVITSLSNGGFVISWQDQNSTSGDIRAQVYGADGSKVGGELSINSVTANNQNTPAITGLPNGGFVVAWTSQGANSPDVKAQVYAADGTKVGGEFLVNSTNPNFDQERASVATLANGDFIVTWNDFRTGDWQVRGQVFHPTASGATKVGSEIIVDTAFYNNRMVAGVTGLADGNFVISFEDTSGEIRAQVFTATGTKVGSEFQVNTQTSGNQGFSSITALTTGGFVVTWSDEGTGDGNGSGIKAQVYDAGGNKIGGEYIVNQYTDNVQYYPTVAALANGGFVITWQDFSQKLDTNSYGIVAQIFNLSNAPTAPSIVSVTDDVSPNTGALANGASTNDTDLTVRIATGSNFAGDIVQLFDGQTAIGTAVTLTTADIARGYIDLQTGTLSNATHAITAKVTDTTGAQSDAASAINVTVDTLAPAVAVTGVTVDNGNLPNVTVSGTTEAGLLVSVYDGATLVGTTTAGADGSWSLSGVTLSEGANNLSAKTTDAAGNTGTSANFAGPTVISTGTTLVDGSTTTSMGYIVLGTATLRVLNGGTVSGQVTVGNGGTVDVWPGATAQHVVVVNGGVEFDYGTVTGTTVESGGKQHVLFGGSATGTTVAAGGYQDVYRATVTDTILSGSQQVGAGATATHTTIENGGSQYVAPGGVADGSVVHTGGFQFVDAGGSAINTIVAGGDQAVVGTTTGGSTGDGSTSNFGTSINAQIQSGGAQHVYSGGKAFGATIAAGGFQDVANDGTVTDTIVSGSQQILAGGLSVRTAIVAGGNAYIGAGGTAKDSVVYTGGLELVDAGATATNTLVDGGFFYVVGNASGSTVRNGGTEEVAGGVSDGAIIGNGGTQRIDQNGTATNATVNTSGIQNVNAGATATDTVLNGGVQYVAGSTSNTTVDGGGQLFVGAGGVSTDAHLVNGFEYVSAGGTAQGVDFAGAAATLLLDDASGLAGTVSNFEMGDSIDLLNTSVSSFAFDGSKLTLATNSGSYAYEFAGLQSDTEFYVGGDGHGGTVISLVLLTQHSASLVPEAGVESGLAPQDATQSQITLASAH